MEFLKRGLEFNLLDARGSKIISTTIQLSASSRRPGSGAIGTARKSYRLQRRTGFVPGDLPIPLDCRLTSQRWQNRDRLLGFRRGRKILVGQFQQEPIEPLGRLRQRRTGAASPTRSKL